MFLATTEHGRLPVSVYNHHRHRILVVGRRLASIELWATAKVILLNYEHVSHFGEWLWQKKAFSVADSFDGGGGGFYDPWNEKFPTRSHVPAKLIEDEEICGTLFMIV